MGEGKKKYFYPSKGKKLTGWKGLDPSSNLPSFFLLLAPWRRIQESYALKIENDEFLPRFRFHLTSLLHFGTFYT